MAAGSFDQLAKKVDAVAAEFDGRQLRKSMEIVGKDTTGDINQAVHGTLGDNSMSGWRRKKPIPISGAYKVASDHEIDMTPTRMSVGPMRVLEDGRQAYQAGDKRRKGTYKSKKTGLVTERFRTVKRSGGATRGKGTWSDASELMAENVPGRIHRVVVVGALRRHIGKG